MSLQTFIPFMRAEQRTLMVDTATVTRPGEGGSLDPVTGVWTPAATTVVYEGACLLRGFNWQGTDMQHGDVEVRIRGLRTKFPADSPLEMDDIIVPTASTFDESLIGRSLRVTDVLRDGWQICRVCIVDEIVEGLT